MFFIYVLELPAQEKMCFPHNWTSDSFMFDFAYYLESKLS